MANEQKEKKTRTPKSYDSIEKGALALSLVDQVKLCKLLHDSIKGEVSLLKQKANEAEKFAEPLNGKS